MSARSALRTETSANAAPNESKDLLSVVGVGESPIYISAKTLNNSHVIGLSNQMDRRCGGVRDWILGISSIHGSGLRLSIAVGRSVPAVIRLVTGLAR